MKHQSVKFGPILPEKRQTNDDNPIEKKRLKSVVIVPPTTTNNKQLTTEKTKDAVTSPHYLRTFLETTMPKYGFPEYTVPKQNLPPRYTETNPDATTLFIQKEKLDRIQAQKISAQEKRNLIINARETIRPLEENYDFFDFDLNKLNNTDYGDLGLDFKCLRCYWLFCFNYFFFFFCCY